MHAFYKYWKRLLVKKLLIKNKKRTFNSALPRIKQIYVEDFIFKKISTCSSDQLTLEAYENGAIISL